MIYIEPDVLRDVTSSPRSTCLRTWTRRYRKQQPTGSSGSRAERVAVAPPTLEPDLGNASGGTRGPTRRVVAVGGLCGWIAAVTPRGRAPRHGRASSSPPTPGSTTPTRSASTSTSSSAISTRSRRAALDAATAAGHPDRAPPDGQGRHRPRARALDGAVDRGRDADRGRRGGRRPPRPPARRHPRAGRSRSSPTRADRCMASAARVGRGRCTAPATQPSTGRPGELVTLAAVARRRRRACDRGAALPAARRDRSTPARPGASATSSSGRRPTVSLEDGDAPRRAPGRAG